MRVLHVIKKQLDLDNFEVFYVETMYNLLFLNLYYNLTLIKFLKITFQTTADGLCMVRAILQQVVHYPTVYMPDMAMRQAAMFMLHHPSRYYKFVEEDLLYTGESY